MTEVVVVGDVMTDVVVRPLGAARRGTDQAADIAIGGGGSAANLACWLAACGVGVTLAARVGAADHAAQIADLLAHQVTPRLAPDERRPTGRVVALVHADGERSFFTDRGANAALCAADLPFGLLDGARLLHVSGHALIGSDAARPLMREASARGVAVSVDAGSAGWLGGGVAEFLAGIAASQLCFANAREAALLWPDGVPALPGGVVVVTRGSAGATAHWRGGHADVAAPAVAVVDTVGAGDGFAAGFLAAHLRSGDPEACLADGVATAARALETSGGRPVAAYRSG